jgi:hypothetical protein
MDTKEQDLETGRYGLFRIYLVFGLLVVAYFGSVGPAWKLHQHNWFKQSTINAFYTPADWVVNRSPALQKFSWWYIHDFWRVRSQLYIY